MNRGLWSLGVLRWQGRQCQANCLEEEGENDKNQIRVRGIVDASGGEPRRTKARRFCNRYPTVMVAVVMVAMVVIPGAEGLCDATCKCSNPDPPAIGEACLDQGICGNKPCVGAAECINTPPASASAIVTGQSTIAIYWEDPTNYDMVDQYNVYYTMTEGAATCTGKSSGASCSFTVPGENTPRSGQCEKYDGGSTLFCWLILIPEYIVIPPCTQTAPANPTCNYQDLAQGIVIGRHFYFKINAGRCCYGDILETPGCSACTAPNQYAICPKSPDFAYADVVALGWPTAVRNTSIAVSGDAQIRLDWILPADTGSLTSNVGDLILVRVTRSNTADFSSGNVVSDLANTALTFSDSGLTPGTIYYYKIETGNSACNSQVSSVCGGSTSTSITAVGIPSQPASFASRLIEGLERAWDISWSAPSDSGQGNGSPSTAEPLVAYNVLLDGVVVTSQLETTYRISNLVIGQTYVFAVRAKNQAGNGASSSLTRKGTGYPSAPQSFSASVSSADGPLKIRLTWTTPSTTGQGIGNTYLPITGYKVLLASGGEVLAGGVWNSNFASFTTHLEESCASTAACPTSTVLTFSAARFTPYVVRVFARNEIGYGPYSQTYEQAVDLPSEASGLTASVSAPNTISLSWILPTDTGVGDQTRPLINVLVKRSFGTSDLSCTLHCQSCSGTCIRSQIGACCEVSLSSSSTSVTVTNVAQSETRYYFQVSAGNVVGIGLPSNIANEQGVSLPSAPTLLATTFPAALAMDFSWNSPADTGVGACSADCRPIFTYVVLVVDSQGSTKLSATVPSTVLNQSLTSLSHQKTYTITIKASNSAGVATASAQLIGERPRDVPTVPTSFAARVGTTAYRIDMSWGTPIDTGATGRTEPITNYVIEVDIVTNSFLSANTIQVCGTGSTCPAATFASCVCNALTATITLTARRQSPYFMRIKALNQYGAGGYALASQVSVGIPSAPTSIAAYAIGVRSINVSWTAPSDRGLGDGVARDLHGYILQRSYARSDFSGCATGSDANDNCASTSPAACCTYAGLTTDTYTLLVTVPTSGIALFYFRAFAKNEVGVGVASAVASEQGVDLAAAPQFLTVTTIGPAQFRVDWNHPLDYGVGDASRPLVSYLLEVSKDPIINFSEIYFFVGLGPTITTFTKRDFIGGTNYTFRVSAKNDAGIGAASNSVKAPAIALPGPPRSFTAVVSTPLVISLAWTIPADTGFGDETTTPIREYRVNVSTANFTDGGGAVLFSGGGSDFTYVHTGLAKAVKYFYRVFARSDAGWSEPSTAFEEGVAVPTAPLNLALNITSPLQIGAVWQLPADTGTTGRERPLTQLTLKVLASPTALSTLDWGTPSSLFALSTSTTSYLLKNLVKGYFYYFRLITSNSAGEGDPSTIENERGVSVPDRPTSLTALIIDPLSFRVSFSAPLDTGLGTGIGPSRLLSDSAFKLQVDTSSLFPSPTNHFLSNTTLSKIFTGLIKNQRYYFRVFASNAAGISVASVPVNQLAIDLPTAPTSPAVVISTANERELVLTWQVSVDTGSGDTTWPLMNYRVQEQKDSTPTSSSLNISVQNPGLVNQRIVRSGLAKGSFYHYRIFASNTAGEGPASIVVFEMSIDKPTVPRSPSLVIIGSKELLFSWTIPADTGNGVGTIPARALIKYEVLTDATSPAMTNVFTPTSIVSPDITNFTRNPAAMIQGTVYYMTVKAYNSAGASPATPFVFNTAVAVPTAPLNLVAVVNNPLQIQLSWDTPTNTGGLGKEWALTYYKLVRSTQSDFAGEVVLQQDLNKSRLEVGLTKGVDYFYRVYAINEAGQGAPSVSAFEQGVDLPSAPLQILITHPAELSLKVSWQLPSDTGLGNRNRPLLRYILETENVFTGTNGTFGSSPYPLTESVCYLSNSPPCDPAQYSQLEVNIHLETSYSQVALLKGNTHYYRVRAVNSAGAGPFSNVVFEQAMVLPSGPVNIRLTLTQYQGQAAYRLDWETPLETGTGLTAAGQPLLNYRAAGQARTGTIYEAQAAENAAWAQPDVSLATTTNLTALKTNVGEGVVFHFRVSAVNEIGRGPWTAGATSGPQVDSISPTSGGAAGGEWVTVFGQRFGTSALNIKAWIGDSRCEPIVVLTPDKSFRCVAAPGTGGSKILLVSIVGLETTLSPAFFYLGPQIFGLDPDEIDADGGQAVTIAGKNFGAIDMTPQAFLQGKGSEPCSATFWSSDTSVLCWVGPATSSSLEKSGVSINVDGLGSGPDLKVQLVRTGLEKFLSECPIEASSQCFDCALRACYSQRVSAAQAAGAVEGGDILDECELAAAAHCKLDVG